MIDVHEINNLHELAAYRSTWHELLHGTAGFSFFQTLEWLETAWDHYPLRQRLRAMMIHRDGRPAGIVPFCVRCERRRVGTVRVLTYPVDDWGTFYGPIGPDPKLAMRAAIRHVAETRRDWDVIDLRWVDEAADEFLTIGESLREMGYDFRVRPRMEVRICRFGEGWDAYVQTRSSNWRRKMRIDIGALEQHGELRLVRYRPAAGDGDAQGHDEIYDICEQLSAKTWQSQAESQSCLSSPRVRDVLHRLHHRAAALGMLDVNLLYVNQTPVAFNYNYVANGRTYGLRCGYDPTLGLEGCGRVLLYKMLEDSFNRGDVEYNFGPGGQPYKARFATEMRHSYTFRHFARFSLRSQLLKWHDRIGESRMSEDEAREQGLVT